MKEKQVVIVAVFSAIVIGMAFWWTRNTRGTQRRGAIQMPKAKGSRRSDQRELSPQERRVKRQAKKLLSKGKIHQAAQLLEQVGLYRDAISTLEDAKFIDDAVKVLLRMQKPERAGVVYSRHGYWQQAAHCFNLAGNKIDAAKCFREAGHYMEAADLFAKEKANHDAAECYQQAKSFVAAAQYWIRAHETERAIHCWIELAHDPIQLNSFEPTDEDCQLIFNYLKSHPPSPSLVSILVTSPKIHFTILDLIKAGDQSLATELFLKCEQGIAESLVSNVNIQSQNSILLAKMFEETKRYRFSAMIYEQLGEYQLAANAFILAGDEERARYCTERLQSKGSGSHRTSQASKENKIAISSHTSGNDSNSSQIPVIGGFVIEATGSNAPTDLPPPPTHTTRTSFPTTFPQASFTIADQPQSSNETQDISQNEAKLLRRDWLFESLMEDDIDQIIGYFKITSLAKDQTFKLASSQLFFGMVTEGSIRSNGKIYDSGQWVGLEESLASLGEREAVALDSTRVLTISQSDIDRLLSQNVDLTRSLYTNLTRQIYQDRHNLLISKAS